MQVVLDEPLVPNDNTSIRYAGFSARFGASIVDAIVLMPVVIALTYVNMNSWRSLVIQVLVSLVSVGYKPVMEYLYGATVGKMAVKIKVTDLNYEMADLGKILLRNIFNIVPSVLSLVFMIGASFGSSDFDATATYRFEVLGQNMGADMALTFLSAIIAVADGSVLLMDQQKRSIHDKIAGTFVIER